MPSNASKATSRGWKAVAREAVIDAALDLIAQQGWRRVSAEAIIRAGGVTPVEFYREFDDALSVVRAGSRRLNAALLEAAEEFEPDESVRDKLFAMIMARFDAAEPWRPTFKTLADAARTDPALAAVLAWGQRQAARLALETAGVNTHGPAGHVRLDAFIAGVMLPTGRAWLKDDTADLSKTMAELDRRLGTAERFAGRLGPLAGGRSSRRYGKPVETDREPGPDTLKTEKQEAPAKGGTAAKGPAKAEKPKKAAQGASKTKSGGKTSGAKAGGAGAGSTGGAGGKKS